MTLNKKTSGTVIFIMAFVIYFLWETGPLNPHKTSLNNGLTIVKEENSFSIGIPSNKRRDFRPRYIFSNVDSIILTVKYGSMLYASKEEESEKKWYYVDASNTKNVYGGYSPTKLREEEIVTIGEKYLDSIKTSNEIWNIHK